MKIAWRNRGRICEFCLISAVVLAALTYGGTEAPYFSVVQILILGLGILLFARYSTTRPDQPRLPVAPLFLIALVLLQIELLPGSVVQLFDRTRDQFSGTSFAPISLAPYETISQLFILLTYLAAFYLTLIICQHRNGSRHLVYALLALGTFEAFYGLFQYLTGWQQIFTHVKTQEFEAATGTYINPNHYAGLLEMILPFGLALAYYRVDEISRSQPCTRNRVRDFFSSEGAHKLLFWLSSAIILFVALVFSGSRMGIISAIASTLLIFALLATCGSRRISAAVLVILFLAAGVWMVVWIGPQPVMARFGTLGQEYAATGQNRWSIWQDTLQLVRQRPWLGTGLGTFLFAYPSVQNAFPANLVSHAHNDYLEFASELGLPSALLLFGSVFYVMLKSVRGFQVSEDPFHRAVQLGSFGGLAAILLHSLADFNLHIPANGLLFAVVLGLAYASSPSQLHACPDGPNSVVHAEHEENLDRTN